MEVIMWASATYYLRDDDDGDRIPTTDLGFYNSSERNLRDYLELGYFDDHIYFFAEIDTTGPPSIGNENLQELVAEATTTNVCSLCSAWVEDSVAHHHWHQALEHSLQGLKPPF